MKIIYQKLICSLLSLQVSMNRFERALNFSITHKMKALLFSLAFLLFALNSKAQTPLSGIINEYAAIFDLDACESIITVDNATGFSIGEEVLLIQMKGAIINESNSNDFGIIEDLGSAGLFEKNEIVGINANEITLKYFLVNDYDVTGGVQLVSFPEFDNVVITDTLTAMAWDGSIGGVLALQVTNELSLEAPIDVSGKGFRGAQTNTLSNDCNFLTNADDYHYPMSNWRGTPKGEGIAAFITGKEQGRGAQANGGGGGNDHNTGGGGGSNNAQGGNGGKLSTSGFNCNGENPGVGGLPLPVENNRVYMGGGGGAGHDNNSLGTAGGNGGGIVIIMAGNIVANGHSILANGMASGKSISDGAGGGGGGGTVILQSNQLLGLLNMEVKGGNGGDVENNTERCIGPGGGGSGGTIVTNNMINLLTDLSGGDPGKNLVVSNQCSDLENGATAGKLGLQNPFDSIPFSNIEVSPTEIISQPAAVVACENNAVFFEFDVEGVLLEYQWQMNDGSGWVNISPGGGIIGENTSILEILSPSLLQNGFMFRCMVSGPCTADLFSQEVSLTVEAAPVPTFSFNSLGNNQYQFENNSMNAISYMWDFGDGMMSSEINPQHTYSSNGQFVVTLTAINDCGEVSFSQTIEVGEMLAAAFIAEFINPCVPATVQFQDQSSGQNIISHSWVFEGGNPPFSTLQNPIVTYSQPGIFDVELTVVNSNGANTQSSEDLIEVFEVPFADFDFSIDTIDFVTVSFTNNSTGGTYQIWEFGDGTTSDEFNPVHTYTSSGLYKVQLTVANDGCGSATSQEFYIDISNNVLEENFYPTVSVYPNPAIDRVEILFLEILQKNTSITLMDTKGQVLKKSLAEKKIEHLDVSYLPEGLYFIQINIEQEFHLFKISKIK